MTRTLKWCCWGHWTWTTQHVLFAQRKKSGASSIAADYQLGLRSQVFASEPCHYWGNGMDSRLVDTKRYPEHDRTNHISSWSKFSSSCMGGWYKICSTLQPKNWSIVLVRVQCVLVSENDRLSQFIGIKHAFVAGGTPLTFTTFQSPKWFVYCLIQIHVTCVCLFFFICSPTFSCLQQLWGSYNDQDVVADGAESTHGILASRMEGNFTNLETARWIFHIDEM